MANTHNIAVSWRDETQRIDWPKFPGLFRDGVKIDNTSESHGTLTGSQNEGSFAWVHMGGTNVKAVLVFVFQGMLGASFASNDYTSGVQYGGVSMNEIAAGRATDTGAETAAIKTFLLNNPSDINQGRQLVTVFRTSNDVNMYAVCITLTAENLLELTGIRIQEQNQVANAVLVTDGFSSSNGTSSLRIAAAWTGDGTQLGANSETTILQSMHNGSNGFIVGAETTPGMGERLVGFFKATADDFAAVYVAAREQNVSLEPARRQEGLLATLAKPAIVGKPFNTDICSTTSILYLSGSTANYIGGVLNQKGEVHFVCCTGDRGQKIDRFGNFSTYSLTHTSSGGAYAGGVLAPNGDIHFVPSKATVGQKVSINGTVSTYSLVYTDANGAYFGGCLLPNGEIHFANEYGTVGQKVHSVTGLVSTYSLIHTYNGFFVPYQGAALDAQGNMHMAPYSARVGQKIDVTGAVSTYSLVYTTNFAYSGGVLAPNGDLHFVPYSASVGQKVDRNGVVSTYSLVYTVSGAYFGGCLAPNGDIHFAPWDASVGQKISADGTVSTYSIPIGAAGFAFYHPGTSAVWFFTRSNNPAIKVHIPSAKQMNGISLSPWFNKY